jgi:fido (protein-threonine AMPylation protein)
MNQTLNPKLADDLRMAHKAAQRNCVVQSKDIERDVRERLERSSWLKEVYKGFYLLVQPEVGAEGESYFYPSYLDFCSVYLNDRFGTKWFLSAESSVDLHLESTKVPTQLYVHNSMKINDVVKLPHGLSIVITSSSIKFEELTEVKDGICALRMQPALAHLQKSYFQSRQQDLMLGLSTLSNVDELTKVLASQKLLTQAARLASALRQLGRVALGDQIIQNLGLVGLKVPSIDLSNETETHSTSFHALMGGTDLYKNRITLLWEKASLQILDVLEQQTINFLQWPGPGAFPMDKIKDLYSHDSFNSLSIEGYQVSIELIQKIESGNWNPSTDPNDKETKDKLAAIGYRNAFFHCSQFLSDKLGRSEASKKEEQTPFELRTLAHQIYQQLFLPGVESKIGKMSDLFGTRNGRVLIKGSRHVTPRFESVSEYLDALFELIENEKNPWVAAILAHFFFVWIHPYMDGNGRTTRLLMNTILVSKEHYWCVVRKECRTEYLRALEAASVSEDWRPFAALIFKEAKATFDHFKPW